MRNLSLILVFFLSNIALWAQNCLQMPKSSIDAMREDVFFLADDKLQGRKPGSEGAIMARDYIQKVFEDEGINPAFKEGYLQEFLVPVGVNIDREKNKVLWDKKALQLNVDYYPIALSGNSQVSGKTHYVSFGIESKELDRDDVKDRKVKGAIAVMEISSPDGIHPHSKYKAYHPLEKRIQNLKDKGAEAIILVHTKGNANSPAADFKKVNSLGLPVIFLRNEAIAQKFKRRQKVTIQTDLKPIMVTAYNVGALIDNNAQKTVVIGAHYDHLGMGGDGSRYTGDQEEIVHNGADDNASGTAGLLQLARFLAQTENPILRQNNYLFLAFSAEEMGLLGSNFYIKNRNRRLEMRYMFNMDMIGRMEENRLAINGVGTSPVWQSVLGDINCHDLQLELSESGVGPSDHTSFYYEDVPVIHFFTGTHTDYHKPSDDAEKINFDGMYFTLNLMLSMMEAIPVGRDVPFSATKVESTKAPRFSVTLGVMPDYLFSGRGMKIDGVSPDKPAAAAGLKEGDVVTKLGEVEVINMQSYMQALSQLKSGDQTTLEYVRNGESQRVTVQF